MNNKGFTLAELLATVVVLSIIISLSVVTFTGVRTALLEKQYENILNRILGEAEKYAEGTQNTDIIYVNVDDLIKGGHISADDDKGYIYDPRDNSILNCFVIKIQFIDGEYIASFDREHSMTEDGLCDTTYTEENSIGIYCSYKNGEPTNCNAGWYDDNVVLSVHGLTDEELNNSKIEWTNLFGLYQNDENIKNISTSANEEAVQATQWSATVTMPSSDGGEKKYNLSKYIKIDREKPVLISRSFNMDYKSDEEQLLSLDVSDLSGSGVASYAITQDACTNASYVGTQSKNIKVSTSLLNGVGSYNICIKDAVGNVYESQVYIKSVTYNLADISNPEGIRTLPIYYFADDVNFSIYTPSRPGYEFNYWVDENNKRIYNLKDLDDETTLKATWKINEVEVPVVQIETNNYQVINSKIDLTIIFDDSGSINSTEFSTMRDAIIQLINSTSFDVGSTVSLIKFSNSASYIAQRLSDRDKLINLMSGTSHYGGGTNFQAAFSYAMQLYPDEVYENSYVLFLSDGYPNSGTSDYAINSSNTLRSKGVTVYSLGVGSGVSTGIMISIAGGQEHYFPVTNFSELNSIFQEIVKDIVKEVTISSNNGRITLGNLVVNEEKPFRIKIGETEYSFTILEDMMVMDNPNEIMIEVDNEGVYYLNMLGVDNYFKLDGDFTKFNFSYSYIRESE